MKNNIDNIYALEIIRYENNETLYILLLHEIDKKSIIDKKNIWLTNIQYVLETINKYELKIKLNLLGLSFRKLTADTCYNTDSNKSIKSSKNFTLKSSYEN